MPEVPEITLTCQYLTSKIKNKILSSIKIKSGRYTHEELQGLNLIKNKSLIVKSVNSHGKFLWLELTDDNDDHVYIMVTFGLTGYWSFNDTDNKSRIQLKLKHNDKKINLYFFDQRNFGTIVLTNDKNVLDKKLNKLAPDVLQTEMSDKELSDMIKKFINKKTSRDKNIVKTLMNQELIVSGIGNYLVAEILYDAKINPHRSFDELTNSEIKKIAHSMRKISKFAYYDNTTGYMENISEFANKHHEKIKSGKLPDYHPDIEINDSFVFNVYNQKHDPKKNIVKRDEIVKGRTIYWCPNVQK